ncbi:hypothetical protein PR048_018680 [Dryococelus australis]|uniref:YqaJ viral recombinase domain-containing protein n=1 Tax=Dryococelus australis TaxID=614101 RepID=A0ABQ9HCZ0_9NEOP|nr:hypothetical protein PR048_018680 [Dryococelus australis]
MSHESNDTMLLESILYSNFYGNQLTGYGIENESNAIAHLEQEFCLAVNPSGLFINKELTFLAATLDGLIGSDSIVEIKCPASARTMRPEAAVKSNKVNFRKLKMGKCISRATIRTCTKFKDNST